MRDNTPHYNHIPNLAPIQCKNSIPIPADVAGRGGGGGWGRDRRPALDAAGTLRMCGAAHDQHCLDTRRPPAECDVRGNQPPAVRDPLRDITVCRGGGGGATSGVTARVCSLVKLLSALGAEGASSDLRGRILLFPTDHDQSSALVFGKRAIST